VPLAERPMMPQLARAVVDFNEEGLRDIWHGYGIKCVVMTFGSFGGSRPSDYDRLAPFGIYTADDCAGMYRAWSPVGTVDPCCTANEPEDQMQTIGPDHGITATFNRLRDLDPGGTLLVKDAKGKWPSISTLAQPVKDWKAYDKAERSLTILVEDHG
jgi:hypothetical protein